MEKILTDLRYGAKMLWKSKGVTIVAVASLAIGIGANSAIFSLVNSILLRPRPVSHPEQLVEIYVGEGEHPYHLDTPRFFGVGEIFWESDMMHASPTLQGWFSVYPLEKLDSSMRKSTEYRLATEAETQIVNGVDKSALKKLINDKVRERNLIRE